MPYRVVARIGAQVKRSEAVELDQALGLLEAEGRATQASANAQEIDLISRRIEPVQQVLARVELRRVSGDRLFDRFRRGKAVGGVDVRGDGSAEAYIGQVHRTLVEQVVHEDAFGALRRAVRATES